MDLRNGSLRSVVGPPNEQIVLLFGFTTTLKVLFGQNRRRPPVGCILRDLLVSVKIGPDIRIPKLCHTSKGLPLVSKCFTAEIIITVHYRKFRPITNEISGNTLSK